jgi:hypothetical protein
MVTQPFSPEEASHWKTDVARRKETMTGFGTDVVALACIVGSATASGVVTLAFMDGEGASQPPCPVEAFSVSPNVVLSHGGEAHAIVMTAPRLRIRSAGAQDCSVAVAKKVRVDMEVMRRQMEEARARMEEARLEAREVREAAREARIREREIRMSKEEALRRVEEARAEVEEALEGAREAQREALLRAQEEAVRRLEAVKKEKGGTLD